MAISKERMIHLINHLSAKDFDLVGDLLERLVSSNPEPELALDDEPTTPDDFAAIKAAHDALEKNQLISLKDIEHELRG